MKNQFRRMTAGILAMLMVISSPVSSLAEVKSASPSEVTTEYETASPSNASYQDEEVVAHDVEKESDAGNISTNTEEDDEQSDEAKIASPSEAEEIAFNQSQMVDGVVITVTADAGVFPKEAKLKVIKVINKKDLKEIDAAVEEVREEDKNVASSNTFDIQILDKEGKEIEPDNSKGTVNVKFSLAEKLNEVLDVAVYHVEEATPSQIEETETTETDEEGILLDGKLTDDVTEKAEENEEEKEKPAETPYKAEALETEITKKKKTTEVEVKTESFSVYVVEFTYGDLQYVLEGNTSVKLSEIQEKIGLPGKVTAASSSNADYFTVTKDATGEDWTVTAKKAFDSEEKLAVKIGEKEFIIKVTDDNTITYFLPGDSWVPDDLPKNEVRNITRMNVNDILTIQEDSRLKRHGTFYGPIDTKNVTEAYLRDSGTLVIYCQEGYVLRYANNASGMFKGFSSLRSYSLTRFFGIEDVVSLDYMFEGCARMHSIYLNRELNDEISCAGIFKGCDNLLVIGLGERFNKASELLPSDKKYYTNWPESGKKTYTNKTIEPGDVYVTDLSKAAPIQYGSGGADWPDIAFTGETYDILSTEDIDMGCEPAKGYYNFIDNTNNPKTGKPYGTVYVEGQIVKQSSNMNEFELGWHTLTPVKSDEKHKYEITAVRNLPDTDEDVEEGYLPAEDVTVKCEEKYPVNIDTLVWVARYTYDSENQSYHITIEDEFAGEIICEKEIKPGDKTIEYTITYVLDGGKNNALNPTIYTATTETITLANPTKTGYTFGGWFSDDKFTKQVKTIAKGSTGNKTFYAKWTANAYKIAFNANGGTGTAPKTISTAYGKTVTLTANQFKKTGYTFTGWNTKSDGSGTKYANKASVKNLISESGKTVTLYAQWKKNTYTITYELNGGKNNSKNPASYTITTADIKLQNPSRTGYAFAGWYSDSKLTKKATTTIKKGSTGNKTFYAKWTANTYKIAFSANGGTGTAPKTISTSYGKTVTLPANPFKRTGYTFTGWNTKKDGKGTAYANKASVKNLTSKSGATVTLYAQWKVNSYKIAFNANGGTGTVPKTISTSYGKTVTLTANTLKRTGYSFTGWNTKADGKGTKYANKASVKNLTSTSGKTVTLYAQWSKTKYTIKYTLNGGKNSTSNPSSYYVTTSTITLKNPTRTGYTFGGWYSDSKYKTKVTSIKKGSTGNKTLYAKWTATEYKITYNLNSGKNSGKNPATYTITTADIKLANPTRTGYVFGGWYSDSKFKTKVTTIKKGSTGNKTLYAKWGANAYKIAFNANGGTGTAPKTISTSYGKTVTLPANPFKRTGYKFTGWNTAKDGSGKSYANKESVKNLSSKSGATVTLYAQWSKVKYTITYNLNGGTNNKSNPSSYYVTTSTITLKNPTRTGYAFGGWYSDSKFKTKVTNIKKGSTGNKTFYAKWSKLYIPSIVELQDTDILAGKKIGCSICYKGDEWCDDLATALETLGKNYGAECVCEDGDLNDYTQSKQITNMVNNNCDILMIDPITPDGSTKALNKAVDAGIPIIIYDGYWSKGESKAETTVTWDQWSSGTITGEYFVDYAREHNPGEKVKILELTNAVSTHCQERFAGFHTLLDDAGLDYEVIEIYDSQGNRNVAMNCVKNEKRSYDYIVSDVDNGAMGAVAALRQKGNTKVKVFSMGAYGAEPFGFLRKKDPNYQACLDVDPWVLAQYIYDSAINYYEGIANFKTTNIPLYMIDANNVNIVGHK